jgi:transcriptional regulator with XRE-family HTH domain
MTYFKRNIDYLMQQGGFKTETEFADYTGIPQPTINRWRSGEHASPNKNTIYKLANAFGLTENDLRNRNLARESVTFEMTGRKKTHTITTPQNKELNSMQAETIQHFYGHKGNMLVACYNFLHINKISKTPEAQVDSLQSIVDLLNLEIEKKRQEIDQQKHIENVDDEGVS